MRVKAVLFDIDGTLVDSNELHVDAWETVFRGKGVDVARDAIRAQIGKGADQLVPALIPGADHAAVTTFGDAHGKLFKGEYLSRVKPFPCAHDLLARTHAEGLRVVLASSASGDELAHYVDLLKIGRFVDDATSADDVSASKPAPDIFRVALQRAGVGASEAVVVGDSPYDAQAAARSGIATLGLRSGGFSDEVLLAAGAVGLYDDACALLDDFHRAVLER